ncbi:PH domain leucine-rich repeat-containing protein phosphatase 2 [Phytophthora boehmeriae]|uniref:PH domain leucine-rich repeat-containing protein phosphatase 2 n=1 Tax=Phytophthora boehmeriae TaxID=109152 RepID=A0A8T1WR38_9STRA|nr:PH domain leucine-rich repeat-containing protein phosphatase 2 [Phytophthora boehmeriae]
MVMIWAFMGLTSVLLSNIASMLISIKLYRDWDFRVSSVRWLFLTFFVYIWLYTLGRSTYYFWVLMLPTKEFVDGSGTMPLTSKQLDQLGIYATTDLKASRRLFPTIILCFCDVMHFAAAFWVLPLTYELSKIAAKSMDRGTIKEKAKISLYIVLGHALISSFAIAEVVLAIIDGGYSSSTYRLALVIYVMQIITLVYMIVVLFLLKCKGRDVESVNGHFEASPVYQRLKRIMFAYALFACQYEFTSLFTYVHTPRDDATLSYIGLSQVMYNATGLALALCTGCSLPCALRFGSWCIPDKMLVQLVVETNRGEIPHLNEREDSIAPPVLNPVFVVTDIESSSALWGIDDGKIMQRATQVHDDVMRSLLTPYRGYEITTAGDSFQLAFHTIREAVGYCLDVQLQLLAAKWPKELHGLVPATKKRRAKHRVIFRGLRVRMGIHDAMGSDGYLHHSPHAVTGKTIYTGASEVIASEVSDLGAGGQILVTRRIADWLMTNKDVLPMDYSVDYLCDYSIPQVDAHLAVYEVLPDELSRRKKVFAQDQNSRIPHVAKQTTSDSTVLESGLETPSGSPTMWFQTPRTSKEDTSSRKLLFLSSSQMSSAVN